MLSSDSDDESEEEEEEQKQPPGAAALQRALEEARALLGDQPKSKKNKSAFFEDEVRQGRYLVSYADNICCVFSCLHPSHACLTNSSQCHACYHPES